MRAPVIVVAAVLMTTALASVGRASIGGYVETVQPMVMPGSDEIGLRAVTYLSEADGVVGQSIEFVSRANWLGDSCAAASNSNLAYELGIRVTVDRAAGVRRMLEDLAYVDTIYVTMDCREAAERVRRGIDVGFGRADAAFLQRAIAATRAAVLAGAERSWPRTRYVSLRVIESNGTKQRVEAIARRPNRLY